MGQKVAFTVRPDEVWVGASFPPACIDIVQRQEVTVAWHHVDVSIPFVREGNRADRS